MTLALAAAFLFLQGSATGFFTLLLTRLCFGIVMTARTPAKALLVQQWFALREVVLVNGVNNYIYGIVVGSGLVVTPFLLSGLGNNWRAVLRIFGVLFIVLLVLWLAVGRERVNADYRRRQVSREGSVLRVVLSYRDLWLAGLGFLGTHVAFSAYFSFFPTLMLSTYDVSLQWSGILLATSTIVGGIAGIGIGYSVMRLGNGKTVLVALGALMVGSYAGMAFTGSIPLLILLAVLNGVAWGFWPILYTVPYQLPGIRPRDVAVALAFTSTMTVSGITLGPLAVGFLQEAMGDLRLALLVLGVAPISLSVAGTMLRVGTQEVTTELSGADKHP